MGMQLSTSGAQLMSGASRLGTSVRQLRCCASLLTTSGSNLGLVIAIPIAD
jgi:hypothetical protein